MYHRIVFIASVALAVVACSSMGQLTVKDYKSSTGKRVLAGQAQPKAEYRCEMLSQESHPWGLAGNMNRVAATERVTTAAVESAPPKGANYAQIVAPSEATVGGFNVNAFKDAQVTYYNCANLPASAT
jgi:hypothetical protein